MMTQTRRSRVRAAGLALCGIAVLATTACSATALAAPAGPAASAGSRQPPAAVPVVVNCPGQAQTRPGQYLLTCTVGPYFSGLRWATWGPSSALASGTYAVDDCSPTCVGGHFHGFPVLVVLWDVQPRPGHAGERYFTEMTVICTGNHSYQAGGKLYRLPQTWTSQLWQSIGRLA
jgi:hypothetical protein